MVRALIVSPLLLLGSPLVVSGQATPTTENASPVASPVASDIGKTVRADDWTVTPLKASFLTLATPDEGTAVTLPTRTLLVWFWLVNEAAAPAAFPILDATVTDAEGRTVPVHNGGLMSVEDPDSHWREVEPGITYTGIIFFDVASDAHDLVLSFAISGDTVFRLGL